MRMYDHHVQPNQLILRKLASDLTCAHTTIPHRKAYMKPLQNLCLIVSIFVLTSSALAGAFDPPAPLIQNADRSPTNQEIFNAFHSFMPETGLPSRQPTLPPLLPGAAIFPLEFRTIDGTNNNLVNPTLGSANTPFLRTTTNAYGDGLHPRCRSSASTGGRKQPLD